MSRKLLHDHMRIAVDGEEYDGEEYESIEDLREHVFAEQLVRYDDIEIADDYADYAAECLSKLLAR